jgi:DNA primase
LRSAHVTILPDNDEPGGKHAVLIAKALLPVVASVKVVLLPELPPKGDVSDWLAAGHTRADLEFLVNQTPEWSPE